jgi:multidrug efflux pump
VTLFGVFLTPVFFYVIQGFGEAKLFAAFRTRLVVSCTAGVFLGAGGGYLLGRLVEQLPLPAAVGVGGCAGLLGVLAARGIHRQLKKMKE